MSEVESLHAVLGKLEGAMSERLQKLAKEYSLLRTGRANPLMLESVKIDYYGSATPLKQVAAISIPEARVFEVRPWDPSSLAEIEKALIKADLGAQPQNDGKFIRLALPAMTEERRKEMVKIVRKMAEEFRVAIRNDRHEAIEKIKKAQKARELGEDDARELEGRVQKITDAHIRKVDEQAALKEKEILGL